MVILPEPKNCVSMLFMTRGEFVGNGKLVGILLDDDSIVFVVSDGEGERIIVVEEVGVESLIFVEGIKIVGVVEDEKVEVIVEDVEIKTVETVEIAEDENVESVSDKVESVGDIFVDISAEGLKIVELAGV